MVNLGLFDGIKPGAFLVIYKLKNPANEKKLNIKRKIIRRLKIIDSFFDKKSICT